jgi:hypothetical protein
MKRMLGAALAAFILTAGQSFAQSEPSTAATTATTDAAKPALPVKLPAARVTIVLDGNDVRLLASIARDLYAFSQTPEGHSLIQSLHSGGNEHVIADRFMDAFDRHVSLAYPSESAAAGGEKLVNAPVELHIWYHGPTLEQVVKEVIDEIFVSRPWTRIGARFPRISRNIRERMVSRCNSLYNRIVWRKLRQAHPKYLAQVNGEIDRFTARFKMDPRQVELRAFSSWQQGWAGFSLDGKMVFHRSSREIREAFRDVSDRLERALTAVATPP